MLMVPAGGLADPPGQAQTQSEGELLAARSLPLPVVTEALDGGARRERARTCGNRQ